MSESITYLALAALIGVGATAILDLWSIALALAFGAPLPDYGPVGRWLAYMTRGRFRHDPISASPPLEGERAIGWIVHYLIGVVYAALLLVVWGLEWARAPTIAPALIVGIGTVVAPFLLMQPGMGLGVAASRTPNPAAACLRSLMAHTVFGLGLYVAGWAVGG